MTKSIQIVLSTRCNTLAPRPLWAVLTIDENLMARLEAMAADGSGAPVRDDRIRQYIHWQPRMDFHGSGHTVVLTAGLISVTTLDPETGIEVTSGPVLFERLRSIYQSAANGATIFHSGDTAVLKAIFFRTMGTLFDRKPADHYVDLPTVSFRGPALRAQARM